MSRTYAHKFEHKGFDSQCRPWKFHDEGNETRVNKRFHHHRGTTVVRYNKGNAWWFKPPSWFTTMFVRATQRRQHRDLCLGLVRCSSFEELEDHPIFPHKNLPNADWMWT